jgi:hypothetical protein
MERKNPSNTAISLVCFSLFFLFFLGLNELTSDDLYAQNDQPKLSLRSTPRVGFSPAEILFVGELSGGDDDYQELYCATIEWDWDDDTRSESTPDCDPYVSGESTIRRRFSSRHRFQYPGSYEIRLLLKKRDVTIASARTMIELRGDGRFE